MHIGAGLPRHEPRGVRPALDELLDLRRYGAVTRRLLGIDDERREGPPALPARSQGLDYAQARL